MKKANIVGNPSSQKFTQKPVEKQVLQPQVSQSVVPQIIVAQESLVDFQPQLDSIQETLKRLDWRLRVLENAARNKEANNKEVEVQPSLGEEVSKTIYDHAQKIRILEKTFHKIETKLKNIKNVENIEK